MQIQADEYGGGVAERIHAQLFADAMDALGLDSRYGAYVDHLPGVTLATVNLMSLFGLHRRWRGAIVGHLALFEMESSVPNRRYANGLRRLGCGERATAFFDEHVMADAIHESVAAVDLAGGLARQQPELDARHPVGRRGARRARRPLRAPHAGGVGARASARCAIALSERRSPPDRAARVGCAIGRIPRRSCLDRRLSSPSAARGRTPRCSARGSARSCACRRRTAACATCRSDTARSSRGPASIGLPSWSSSRNGPRTISGPSR